MNCIIIDDEETSRVVITQLCSGIKDLDVIERFPNALEAIKFLNKHDIDLIFLDIHMPDFTGFDFIDTLKNPPKIILTTSDNSLALEAFEYIPVVDYLVKPIAPERFEKAIEKVKALMPDRKAADQAEEGTFSEDQFYINIDRTLIKVDTNKVYLVEAKRDYIVIKTDEKELKVHTTLKSILNSLPADRFFHVHRSYIINLSRIIDIQDNTIVIEKNVVPISRSRRPELMRRLNLV